MKPNFGHTGMHGYGIFLDAWGDGPLLIRWQNRVWRFEFSDMFGPSLLTKDGEIAEHQPVSEQDPFWEPFERWFRAGKKCRAVCGKRGRLKFYLCHVPRHEESM